MAKQNEISTVKPQMSFEEFWKIYDKKCEKKNCIKKWNKISDEDKQLIQIHVVDYVMSTPDKAFRKNPLTYLNGECWNDEIIKPAGTANAQTNTGNNLNTSKYRGIGD